MSFANHTYLALSAGAPVFLEKADAALSLINQICQEAGYNRTRGRVPGRSISPLTELGSLSQQDKTTIVNAHESFLDLAGNYGLSLEAIKTLLS